MKQGPLRSRPFARTAMVGVVVYVVVDIVLQLLPPHYSAISDAESDLGVGPFGWIMALNFAGRAVTSFAVAGALLLGLPRSTRRDIGLVFVVAAGLCSGLLAVFPTDIPALSGSGVAPTTARGAVHLIAASTGFALALLGCWLLTFELRRMPGARRRFEPVSFFLLVATAGMLFLIATIAAVPEVLGLAERICLVGILGWVSSAALLVSSADHESSVERRMPGIRLKMNDH